MERLRSDQLLLPFPQRYLHMRITLRAGLETLCSGTEEFEKMLSEKFILKPEAVEKYVSWSKELPS